MNHENVQPKHEQLASEIPASISERHQASLSRTMRIAEMVKGEQEMESEEVDWNGPLEVGVIDSVEDMPEEPGVYLIGGEVDTDRHEQITDTEFTFLPKILSGKVDSAHAVLPGVLSVNYSSKDERDIIDIEVAAKGFYKREFSEKLERVKNEVNISKLQEEAGEPAFSPVAIVVAPPRYEGKSTNHQDYDLLLVTRLDETITTLDNAPWQLGFNEDNLNLAERGVSALARFNTHVGLHGDAKVKNVAQRPDGQVGMIDFETSRLVDYETASEAAEVVLEDLNTLLDSLEGRGFFSREPYRVHEVLSSLAETYLEHWSEYDSNIQDAVFKQASNAVDAYMGYSAPKTHKLQAA